MITLLFPVWAILLSSIAYFYPEPFIPLKGAIIPFLVIIMFCMGVTLTSDDFRRVLQSPKIIALGLMLQYGIMPFAAFFIAYSLGLENELILGMVLLGASPGGTASNVICYLAKADVALSITMTMLSTLLAVIATPYLTLLLIGEKVPVPVTDMLLSILKIVILPVGSGLLINSFLGRHMKRLDALFPIISMLAIIIIIAVIVALSQEKLASTGAVILLAVVLHNATGLFSGYFIPRLFGFDKKSCKTLAIEVGMQNSGLAVALATKYFSAISALPGALFSIWHNLSGSLLAAYWSRKQ